MIREPYNIWPYNTGVKKDTENKNFTFNFSGDNLESVTPFLYDNSAFDSKTPTEGQTLICPDVFNDDTVTTGNIPCGTLPSGEYLWRLLLRENNTKYYKTYELLEDMTSLNEIKIGTAGGYIHKSVGIAIVNVKIGNDIVRVTRLSDSPVQTTWSVYQTNNEKTKTFSKLYKKGTKVQVYANNTDAFINLATIPMASGIVKKFNSQTELVIGQHSILTDFDNTYDKYCEIIINNVKYGIKSYDYSTGVCVVNSVIANNTGNPKYSIFSNYKYSNYYYFSLLDNPQLYIVDASTTNLIINQRSYLFNPVFISQEGDSIKSHRWTIIANNETIYDSDKIFNSNLNFEFLNFASNLIYTVKLEVMTQKNLKLVNSITVTPKYEEKILRLNPKAVFNKSDNSVLLKWPTNQYSIPKVIGSINAGTTLDWYTNTNYSAGIRTGVSLKEKESLLYDMVNDDIYSVPLNKFTLFSIMSFKDNCLGTFLNIGCNNGNKISLKRELVGGKIKLNVYLNDILVGYDGSEKSPSFYKEPSVWVLNQESPANGYNHDAYLNYVWDNNSIWTDNNKWLESDSSKWRPYAIKVTSNNGKIEVTMDDMGPLVTPSTPNSPYSYKYTFSIPTTITSINSVNFIGPIDIDSWFLANENANIIFQTQVKDDFIMTYQPTWDSLDLYGVILCDYTKDLNSSSSEFLAQKIKKYLIYRGEINPGTGEKMRETLLLTLDMQKMGVDIAPSVEDFSVSNNKTYYYKIYPMTDELVMAYMYSNEVVVDGEGWTFLQLYYDEDYLMYRPNGYVWKFFMNLEEQSIVLHDNKVIHENLSQYPKVSTGETKYITTSFTALFGEYNGSHNTTIINGVKLKPLEYYDTANRIEEFIEMCHSTNPVLVRDNKGFIYLATLTEPNFSINEQIEAMPTTVSFNITQIDNVKDKSIADFFYPA